MRCCTQPRYTRCFALPLTTHTASKYLSVGQMSGSLSVLQEVAGMPFAASSAHFLMLAAGLCVHSVAQSPVGYQAGGCLKPYHLGVDD